MAWVVGGMETKTVEEIPGPRVPATPTGVHGLPSDIVEKMLDIAAKANEAVQQDLTLPEDYGSAEAEAVSIAQPGMRADQRTDRGHESI